MSKDVRSEARKAALDTALVVSLFLVVTRVSMIYGGIARSSLDYNRVAVFSLLFAALNLLLRLTKSSMAHILVNAIYFHLGSLFAKEFIGH